MKFERLIDTATTAVEKKEYIKAIEYFQKALQIEPKNKKILYNLGVCNLKNERYYEAIEYFLEALVIDPNYTNAHSNLAIAYKKIKLLHKALHHLLISYKAKPNDDDIIYNIANTLSALEEFNDALRFYDKLLAKSPNNHKALYGVGLIYNYLMEYEKAKSYFLQTLKLNPKHYDAIFALSLIQLRDKEYISGWQNYEARWEASNPLKKLSYDVPMYNGEDLKNKTILIQEEQGYGDNIQFIRYLDFIKQKNPKKIYVALRKPLKRVFEKIDGIEIVGDQDMLYDIDYILSLLSAPRIFQTTFETIPNKTPYLPAIKEDVSNELKTLFQTKKLKVGFSYSGNPDHKNNFYRSIPLEIFEMLFQDQNINFYSLQIEEQDKKQKEIFAKYDNVIDLSPHIKDFYDTANIFNHLDLIISIDSALAHFAGAYNIPTCLILPKNGEWRWFDTIDYSPWYPSIKIFRQEHLGVWRETLIKLSLFLKEKR